MNTHWIDFRQLRERLHAQEILAFYKIAVKVKGDQAQGFCPLPGHRTHEGKRRSPSFSINLKRGCFRCFSCGQSGNCIDLVCLLEGLDPEQPADVRKAAVLLDERYPLTGSAKIPSSHRRLDRQAKTPPDQSDQTAVVNAPLDFDLKSLDYKHPYLLGRGFTPETVEHFGLGFCSKGLMKDRIAIPLRDHSGQLVGYAGRVVDDELISDDNPRYRFPSGREKDGVYFDFQKHLFLYNGHALAAKGGNLDEMYVGESFTSVWWLTQLGFADVVSVMGASCSPSQGQLIAGLTKSDAVVTILSDGDDAGERCAISIFKEVSPLRRVRWAKLEAGRQPTDCSADDLEKLLRS